MHGGTLQTDGHIRRSLLIFPAAQPQKKARPRKKRRRAESGAGGQSLTDDQRLQILIIVFRNPSKYVIYRFYKNTDVTLMQPTLNSGRTFAIFGCSKRAPPHEQRKTNHQRRWRAIFNELDIKFIQDGARHSFATYYLAQNTMDDTIQELGHTDTKMLFKHYRGLAKNRKKQAKAYFNIAPAEDAKIIPISKAV